MDASWGHVCPDESDFVQPTDTLSRTVAHHCRWTVVAWIFEISVHVMLHLHFPYHHLWMIYKPGTYYILTQ